MHIYRLATAKCTGTATSTATCSQQLKVQVQVGYSYMYPTAKRTVAGTGTVRKFNGHTRVKHILAAGALTCGSHTHTHTHTHTQTHTSRGP